VRKIYRKPAEVISFDSITPTDTVGLIIEGRKFISVRHNDGTSKVRKMSHDMRDEKYYYDSNKHLLNAFPKSHSVHFDNTKEALTWLVS